MSKWYLVIVFLLLSIRSLKLNICLPVNWSRSQILILVAEFESRKFPKVERFHLITSFCLKRNHKFNVITMEVSEEVAVNEET